MSRTRHTEPDGLRAARRVRDPWAPRSAGDLTTHRTSGRILKELGVESRPRLAKVSLDSPAPLPRFRIAKARPGFFHPAGKKEIEEVLRFFGERCTYGLKRIELAHAGPGSSTGSVRFAELRVPGHVVLFEQPDVPWLLPGTLAAHERRRLSEAGATVESRGGGLHTSVHWPGETLRDFMVFDALMHEIGHHLLQQYKGKRGVRIARTRDHEAFAERFARECRLAFCSVSGEEH